MSKTPTKPRDVRIDFFRGLAMFIILVAHIPGNVWSLYIPARYGPSDAADIFVFCSGYVSALAFGGVFLRHGFPMGILRVLHRCWQIYWAQIAVFLVTAAVCILGTQWIGGTDYVEKLNLEFFFDEPMKGLIGLLTVTYVPNYFDILPMYMVMLLMIPAVMWLRQFGLGTVIAASLLLWTLPKLTGLNLPAEWWSERGWFFNPFVWQLVFFTGFAFGAGWLKPPPPKRWLMIAAAVFIIVMVPLSRYYEVPWIWALREATWPVLWQKSQYGIFRLVHLLAMAYLIRCFLLERPAFLNGSWTAPVVLVGQQTLAVFIYSIVAAWTLGMVLDVIGRHYGTVALVNLAGLASLVLIAQIATFYKSQPWRKPAQPRPAPPAPPRLSPGGVPRPG
jgi:hypothetical protein